METKNFVIVGQQPWDTEIGSNCKNIAYELAKEHRVLYVNSPLDRATLLRQPKNPNVEKRLHVIRGNVNGLQQVENNIWTLYPDCLVESINWLPVSGIFDYFNKLNNKRLSQSIKVAVSSLGFEKFVLFNDNEIFKAFYLKELLQPERSIYYSRDFMVGVPYWKRHGVRLEPKLIAKSDLCFTNSLYLRDYCLNFNKHSFYVGQGCELDGLQEEAKNGTPHDISDISVPILGYVGALDSNRLDIELISHIAGAFPAFMIVLVGPEDDAFRRSALHQQANIRFLGKKPINELGRYIQSFSVCLNPQLVNAITIGNYPRKIDEYLALGKPVVATKNPTMEAFATVVHLSETKEAYVDCIKDALTEDSAALAAARRAFAANHTWDKCVSEILNRIHSDMRKTSKKLNI